MRSGSSPRGAGRTNLPRRWRTRGSESEIMTLGERRPARVVPACLRLQISRSLTSPPTADSRSRRGTARNSRHRIAPLLGFISRRLAGSRSHRAGVRQGKTPWIRHLQNPQCHWSGVALGAPSSAMRKLLKKCLRSALDSTRLPEIATFDSNPSVQWRRTKIFGILHGSIPYIMIAGPTGRQ